MLIKGEQGQTVEFIILNYQFPDSINYDDGNWLQIYLKVNSTLGEWHMTYPCLTTREVKGLIEWFRDLATKRKPEWNEQEFMEPNVSFYLLNNFDDETKRLVIKLYPEEYSKEFRPVPVNVHFEYSVVFNADSKNLTGLQMNFRKSLSFFR